MLDLYLSCVVRPQKQLAKHGFNAESVVVRPVSGL